MKSLLTAVLLLCFSICFCQNNLALLQKKNEVKINLAYASFGYIEATYERLLPWNTSAGLVVGKSVEDDDINYHFLSFYRLFFGQGQGSGFFIEANAALWNEESFRFETRDNYGAGIAVGGKFFRGERFHGEVVAGIGRVLSDYSPDFDEFYPRIGFFIGYRF